MCGETLPYDELPELRARMSDISPTLLRYGDLEAANFFTLAHKLIKVWRFVCSIVCCVSWRAHVLREQVRPCLANHCSRKSKIWRISTWLIQSAVLHEPWPNVLPQHQRSDRHAFSYCTYSWWWHTSYRPITHLVMIIVAYLRSLYCTAYLAWRLYMYL